MTTETMATEDGATGVTGATGAAGAAGATGAAGAAADMPAAAADAGGHDARPRGLDGIIDGALARTEAAVDAAPETASVVAPEPAPAGADPAPPVGWPEEDRARFDAWPPDVRQAVSARLAAIDGAHAAYRGAAEPLLDAVRPFDGYLATLAPALGLTQGEMIHGLLRTEHALRTGSPPERAAALREIATAYGVEPATPGDAPGEGGAPDAAAELRRQVLDLTRRLGATEDRARQDAARQREAEIDAFRAAKNADGAPAHPHYERFRAVIEHALASGAAATLPDAYRLATAPLAEALASELETRRKADEAERQAVVARARRAAPVASSGPAPNGTSGVGRGLDSILTSAIDRAGLG